MSQQFDYSTVNTIGLVILAVLHVYGQIREDMRAKQVVRTAKQVAETVAVSTQKVEERDKKAAEVRETIVKDLKDNTEKTVTIGDTINGKYDKLAGTIKTLEEKLEGEVKVRRAIMSAMGIKMNEDTLAFDSKAELILDAFKPENRDNHK